MLKNNNSTKKLQNMRSIHDILIYTHIYTHIKTYKYIDFLGFHAQFLLLFYSRAKEIALSVLNQVNLLTLTSENSLVSSPKLFLQFYVHFNV